VAELVNTLEEVGFIDVAVVKRIHCFNGTSKEAVTKKFGVVGVNVFARKLAR
jgi:hypothetical protein